MNIHQREPAIIISVVASILGVLIAFGLKLTTDQTAAIMAAATVLGGIWTRRHVSPTTRGKERRRR